MKKLVYSAGIFSLHLIVFFVVFPNFVSAQAIDLVDFMAANFNYNGFSSDDSYLELTNHAYSFSRNKYLHQVPQKSCPYPGDCKTDVDQYGATKEEVDWHFYYLGKKIPDQNIIYQSKIIWKGNNLEVFWYNNDWIYDFMEPAFTDQCPVNDQQNPVCFHNFHHENDTNFPNRGFLWYKRKFNSGEEISVPFNYIKYFRNNQFYTPTCNGGNRCAETWPPGENPNTQNQFAKATYYSNWNPASLTWNNKPEYEYNLPPSLEVVVLESIVTKSSEWPYDWKEKYYYARSGNNSFGLIRYDRWEDKNNPALNCGDDFSRCPGIMTEGNLVLAEYSTLNILTKFSSQGTSIDQVFIRSFYTDPKWEKTLGDDRQERGKFKAPGNGQFANGEEFRTGDWITLSEIVTDSDYLISTAEQVNGQTLFCPNGYSNLGSFVGDGCTHNGNCFQDRWVVLCGTTNKAVLAAESCPSDYFQKGFFYSGRDPESKSIYDYQGNDISHGWVNFCVRKDEFSYIPTSTPIPPTATPIPPTPTITSIPPTVTPTLIPGDITGLSGVPDGVVNIYDYNKLIGDFGKTGSPGFTPSDIDGNGIVDIYDYNTLIGNFGKNH